MPKTLIRPDLISFRQSIEGRVTEKGLFGIAVASIGAANGFYFDQTTLEQLRDSGNNRGIAARLDHDGKAKDGALFGSFGMVQNFRIEGDTLRADAIFAQPKDPQSPIRKLVEKVRDFAEVLSPTAGFSVIARPDWAASDDEDPVDGSPVFRISRLQTVDLVDRSASGEGSMFGEENPIALESVGEYKRHLCVECFRELSTEHETPQKEESKMSDSEKKKDAAVPGVSPPVDSRDQEFADKKAELDVREAALAEGERAQEIRKFADEADQIEMADDLIKSGKSLSECMFSLSIAASRDSKGKGKDPAESLADSKAAGANEEATPEFKEAPIAQLDSQGLPTAEAVEAYQAKNEGVTFNDAARTVAQAAQKAGE